MHIAVMATAIVHQEALLISATPTTITSRCHVQADGSVAEVAGLQDSDNRTMDVLHQRTRATFTDQVVAAEASGAEVVMDTQVSIRTHIVHEWAAHGPTNF